MAAISPPIPAPIMIKSYFQYCLHWIKALKEQPTAITEYDESLVRRLIEKVTVYEDKFIVEFKSGVTVDVNE